jgi:hypothetical protein
VHLREHCVEAEVEFMHAHSVTNKRSTPSIHTCHTDHNHTRQMQTVLHSRANLPHGAWRNPLQFFEYVRVLALQLFDKRHQLGITTHALITRRVVSMCASEGQPSKW